MSDAPRLLVAFGTRPEVIKLAPVVHALRRQGASLRTVHTGQHTATALAADLQAELDLVPDVTWTLPTSEAERLGALLAGAHAELDAHRAEAAVVLGDTWTVPLVALAARAHGVPVVHVEAGLRSFNEQSTEEANRRVVATLASLHAAPTPRAADALLTEGVPHERIVVTGNPVTDALATSGVRRRPLAERRGVLMTAHRATNVDDPSRLVELVELARALGRTHAPVTFPLHPRTAARLEAAGLTERLARAPGVALVDPLGYRELLDRLAAVTVVVTDSGGLQEEAAWFGVPTVVLRTSTPRWEGIDAGIATLTGVDLDRALTAVTSFTAPDEQRRVAAAGCPYGDGRCSPRISAAIFDALADGRLTLREPTLAPVAQPAPAPTTPPGSTR